MGFNYGRHQSMDPDGWITINPDSVLGITFQLPPLRFRSRAWPLPLPSAAGWRRLCILSVLVLVVLWQMNALAGQPRNGRGSEAAELPAVCGIRLQGPRLSWELPQDVEGGLRQPNLNVVQRATDLFAWQQFIALNWPASSTARGEPDPRRSLEADGPRVWESWMEASDVYRADGSAPPPWKEPVRAAGAGSAPVKRLHRDSKVSEFLQDKVQPTKASAAFPGTLTDQRGRLVHYEIRMNKILYDYVVANGLFNADRQAAVEEINAPEGSILIKAAWRELEPGDASRFYTATADIIDPEAPAGAAPQRRQVGLVGLHAMQKTASAPQWIWTTYEQVDNVDGVAPSFRDPHCSDCLPNRQGPPGFPNQVTRLTPIPSRDPDCARSEESNDNLEELNRQMQASLPASVWRNYELVGAQWPLPLPSPSPQPVTVFSVRPAVLANTTLETYIQTTSSCMGCHAMARSSKRERYVSSDFSFTFAEALPHLPDPRIIPPPAAPRSRWDRQNWDSILRGYTLSTATYEQLPAQVPTARLHCASCHLDAGGNTQASPWLGMTRKYSYPQTQDLQRRINLCFSHSLNGRPLPLEEDDPTMRAFIVYMQWLDEQARERRLQPPATPFPPIAVLSGEASRGQETFRQKCAFCHDARGQGRYDDGRYYRPALWGPQSFNRQAGMADPAKLAAFLRANMPHRFGGALTDQEAWDLAAFIDGQERPAGPSAAGAGG